MDESSKKYLDSSAIILYLILFFTVFNYSLALMSSVYITWDLGGSKDIAFYPVSFFGIGNALGIPLGLFLSHRQKTVKILCSILLLFAFLSFISCIATTFPILVITRFLQGVVAGPIYLLVNQLLDELVPSYQKNLSLRVTLTTVNIAPVLGACWGGWLAYNYEWRWIFFLNALILFFLAILTYLKLKNFRPIIIMSKFDAIGYIFYFIGVLCLSIVITMGQQLDWFRSPIINALLIIGIPSILFFILWTENHPYPILDFTLFKGLFFSTGIFYLLFIFSAYFGMVILLSNWLSLYINYNPDWVVALIGIMAIGAIFPPFLMREKFMNQWDSRLMLGVALIFLAISSFHTSQFNVEINFDRIAASRFFAGVGLALFLPPVYRLCFYSHIKQKSAAIATVFQVIRTLASGVGLAIYHTIWVRRQVFYHDRLGSKLTSFSKQTQIFFNNAKQFGLEGKKTEAQLEVFLDRQSTALALDDCFYLMGWLAVGLLILLVFTYFRKEAKLAIPK